MHHFSDGSWCRSPIKDTYTLVHPYQRVWMNPTQMNVCRFMKIYSNIKLHQKSGWYCLQPAVYNQLRLSGYIMPPLSVRIHSLNSICSDYNPTSQHYLMINLSMESENMVTLPTSGSSLQPFMFVSAVFTEHLKLFFHHCRTKVQILFWILMAINWNGNNKGCTIYQ